ncbi:MAG: RNB domain-containing ribonuclease, partial [Thermodesulfovibrionales bacterium]|nr:RNB domain-containing ribonuclease [Thermodesulfovibrionales bacterium]
MKIRKDNIIRFLREKARKPLAFRELASRMGVASAQRRHFKRMLRELTDEGEVVRTKRGLYGPCVEMALVPGHFEAHREGYGFVIQEKPGIPDVFIPARATLSAMNGDRVIAQMEDTRRRSGRIVRILKRAHARIAGTIDRAGDAFFLKPKSQAVAFDIYIPPSDAMGLAHGTPALVEITQYPSANRPAMGKVVKELARPVGAADEVGAIIEEFSLPKRFSSKLTKEAEALREKPFGKRRDLTALATVTIDGESAKDFDDAVSIEKTGEGYRLWVHIADVGHYVPWDSPLDIEARGRGTSVYFPGRVVPMLPKALSEDLCSLVPGEPRPAFTVEMEFDSKGKRTGRRFFKSLIRSDERMTY